MEQVGQQSQSLNTARFEFSRCRNTNSRFSFWWYFHLLQEQQKNMMEQVGQQVPGSLNTARRLFRRSRNTNSSISFWWRKSTACIQEQQKNMMEQVGQLLLTSLNTARSELGGAGTQTAALAFGGESTPPSYSSNRRMDRCRSSNKNNNGKLIWQNI
jgi:hypothetical protein